jgi:hypothetical protein
MLLLSDILIFKKYPLNYASLKPKFLDIAIVTPLNDSILNVLNPQQIMFQSYSLATLPILVSFLGWSADLKVY